MCNKHILLVSILTVLIYSSLSQTLNNAQKAQAYDPPSRTQSSTFSIQVKEEHLQPGANLADKYSNGEWNRHAVEGASEKEIGVGSSEYLKFIGVVGTGHIYVPAGSSEKHFENINDGVHGFFDGFKQNR